MIKYLALSLYILIFLAGFIEIIILKENMGYLTILFGLGILLTWKQELSDVKD